MSELWARMLAGTTQKHRKRKTKTANKQKTKEHAKKNKKKMMDGWGRGKTQEGDADRGVMDGKSNSSAAEMGEGDDAHGAGGKRAREPTCQARFFFLLSLLSFVPL